MFSSLNFHWESNNSSSLLQMEFISFHKEEMNIWKGDKPVDAFLFSITCHSSLSFYSHRSIPCSSSLSSLERREWNGKGSSLIEWKRGIQMESIQTLFISPLSRFRFIMGIEKKRKRKAVKLVTDESEITMSLLHSFTLLLLPFSLLDNLI